MAALLFIDGGNWNGVTTVQVNVLNFFADQGHYLEVVLFDNGIKPSQVKMDRWPKGEQIHYQVIRQNTLLDKVMNQIPNGKYLMRLIRCWRILSNYTTYYAFDYEGAIVCSLYQFFHRSKNFFLHSIELYEDTRRSALVNYAFSKASWIVIQDYVRKEKLIELYALHHPNRILESINSSRKSDETDVTPIAFPEAIRNKVKLLFIGSLIDQHCFEEVLMATQNIPSHMCLVVHGWGGEKYEQKVKELVALKPDNIWISDLRLDDVTKFRLYASVDIGLVTFNDAYFNGKYAGLSAGKLYDFMRVGKPVLASDIPGLNDFVIKNEIGLVIKQTADIYTKAERLMMDYEHYSQVSQKLFWKFEFDSNFEKVYKEFLSIV